MDQASISNHEQLAANIKIWGAELGFQQVGITDTELSLAEARLNDWLQKGFHGEMSYMGRHGSKRSRPTELEPGTLRIISVRLDYLPEPMQKSREILKSPTQAFISRYALGRDYHKLMRKRLQQLAQKISREIGDFGYRVYVDSAPVLEKPLAEKAGLGWIGKHSNLINRKAGSWFFLGEIYTDLPLPADQPASNHCGSCHACLDICPTQAIVEPYVVDARRCISYLTIEQQGPIPESLRSSIGNRIYGCDDCQQVCPWNRFAQLGREQDFAPRNGLDSATLTALFEWDETTFLKRTEGSAIRRIGHQSWLRNIAVALGNAQPSEDIEAALKAREHDPAELVREHVRWALAKQRSRSPD
ncbi:MAG: tRNA epoxyqueuosine(34) reductase QueG [gamma proteobacterium endosymbiont of Lamellibrachia anaximandri]|nr:tRNA epoxyqueuosine(34) reductase QueG [gamma proteobacterium endosymbiont of Lamellibrachia anaximandri]